MKPHDNRHEANGILPSSRFFSASTKKRLREADKDRYCCSGVILMMLVLLLVLLAFNILGLSLVTVANPLINSYIHKTWNVSFNSSLFVNNTVHYDFVNCSTVITSPENTTLEAFLSPTSLFHNMTDDELLWRASMVPTRVNVSLPFRHVPKIAFLFLSRGKLPFAPLWDRFFLSAPSSDLFSVYIHAPPGSSLSIPPTSAFHSRQIPSELVKWGSISLVDAERRLLSNALLDFRNERFVLVSESCIPVYNFSEVYDYLVNSDSGAFVESYDENSGKGRGRYRAGMAPDILLRHWRKGSQWFEFGRDLAVSVVAESRYLDVFRKFCLPDCYPDEHYLPTFLHMFHGERNANRTVTWVDWSQRGPHPGIYGREGAEEKYMITPEFIRSIRGSEKGCWYRGKNTSVCYLFARKFDPAALGTLLNISAQVMGY